jgi:hypothetical protein
VFINHFLTIKTIIMVTITNFFEVQRKDGTTFVSLELTGGAEIIQSQNTGKFYVTVRKCRIPSTVDTIVAQTMIGQRLPGEVVKVITEPYDFINPKTGEVISLQHSWAYQPKEASEVIGHTKMNQFHLMM